MARIENLEAFIEQNAPFLTIGDLAEESGWSQPMVRKTCECLKIEAISIKEQHKQYILAIYKRKSPQEIATRLGLGMARLQILYRELKIPFQNLRDELPKARTIRDVFAEFSSYRILGHYIPDCC